MVSSTAPAKRCSGVVTN